MNDDFSSAEVEAAKTAWKLHARLAHPIENRERACEECGYAYGWLGISADEERERYTSHAMRAALAAARIARREQGNV